MPSIQGEGDSPKDYLTWYVGITWGCCNSCCCCCCDCSVRFTFWTWLALLVGRPLPFPEGELGLPWAEPFPFPGKKAPPSENSSRYITKEEIHLGDARWSVKNPTITFPPDRPPCPTSIFRSICLVQLYTYCNFLSEIFTWIAKSYIFYYWQNIRSG